MMRVEGGGQGNKLDHVPGSARLPLSSERSAIIYRDLPGMKTWWVDEAGWKWVGWPHGREQRLRSWIGLVWNPTSTTRELCDLSRSLRFFFFFISRSLFFPPPL